jgi:hypothetical protein
LLPRRQLAGSQMQDSKDVLTAISGHELVSTGTVQCFCCEYASPAPVRQGGSPSVHQKLVDIPYQTWFRVRFDAVMGQAAGRVHGNARGDMLRVYAPG